MFSLEFFVYSDSMKLKGLTPKEAVIKALTPALLPFVTAYWKIVKPKTFGVKVVVEGPDGKILIVRHSYLSGARTFPGGKLKRNEDYMLAGPREVKEELDLDIVETEYIDSFVNTKYGKIDTIHVIRGVSKTSDVTPSPFEIKSFYWENTDEVGDLGEVGALILEMYKKHMSKVVT